MIQLLAIAFVAYAAVSMTWSPGDNLSATIFLVSLTAAFAAGRFVNNLRWLWIAAILWATANVAVALSQELGFRWIDYGTSRPGGLYGNSNVFAAVIAISLAAALAYRIYLFVPIGVFGLLISESRTAVLAFGATLLLILWRHYRPVALIALLLTIAFAVNVPRDGASTLARMGIWQDTLNNLTIFGSGWGSYFEAYWSWPRHTNMTLIRAQHAYNDILEIIFELGIASVFLWIIIILAVEKSTREELTVFTCFAILSITYFPFFIMPIGQLFAMMLGHISRRVTYASPLSSYRQALPQGPGDGMGTEGTGRYQPEEASSEGILRSDVPRSKRAF